MGLFQSKAKKLYKEALPLYEQGRHKEALEKMEAAAELGHKEAMYLCGNIQRNGGYYSQAADWYAKAADRHHAKAKESLAELCIYSSVRRKYNLWEELRVRAEGGDVKAQTVLANDLYEDAKKKGAEACDAPLRWALQAARQGSREAQCLCGDIYFNNKNDLDSAAKWYSLAGEQGDHWGCYGCGRVMKEKKDDEAAAEWFLKAWESGNDLAPMECIHAYARIGTDEACEKVFALVDKYLEELKKSARWTTYDSFKMKKELLNLCGDLCYRQGKKYEAYQWYWRSGYKDEYAVTRQAEMHYAGDGVRKDRAEAYRLYAQLAEENRSANAAYQCGKMCLFGDGVPRDPAKAFYWFSRQRNTRGCFLTISMYELGIGVEQNDAKAKELLRDISIDDFHREQEGWLEECAAHGYAWERLEVSQETVDLQRELSQKQEEIKRMEDEQKKGSRT